MRINKFLSEKGICSRRQADDWVSAGRVTVNGSVAGLGTPINDGDDVSVDGRSISSRQQAHAYIAFNKPVGVTCTTEARIKDNIIDFIGHDQRIFPIGRLDKDSEGLILLTSDGDIVNTLLRSENLHEKEYRVWVNQPVSAEMAMRLGQGIHLPELGAVTKPCKVTVVGAKELRFVLTQGLNRQIRRMCEVVGLNVVRLQRVRFVAVRLEGLGLGYWRDLTEQELAGLGI